MMNLFDIGVSCWNYPFFSLDGDFKTLETQKRDRYFVVFDTLVMKVH